MDINHRARRPDAARLHCASTTCRSRARSPPTPRVPRHTPPERARAPSRPSRRPFARRARAPDDGNAAALDLLERLQRAYETDANGSFVDAVIEAREHLTLLFFDVAEERVRSLEASGDAASAASALDEARGGDSGFRRGTRWMKSSRAPRWRFLRGAGTR